METIGNELRFGYLKSFQRNNIFRMSFLNYSGFSGFILQFDLKARIILFSVVKRALAVHGMM